MSLLVWLPFINNIENQGTSNIQFTNTNAVSNTEGKIGNCYYFNGNSDLTATSPEGIKSVCFWIKTTPTASKVCFADYKSKLGFGFNSNKYLIVSSVNWSIKVYNNTNLIPDDIWTHVAIVKTNDDSDVLLYINGVLQTSRGGTSYWSHQTDTLIIGKRAYSSPANMTFYMNDFRAYSHCLSPAEIHEISQGLVLHYKLDNNGHTNLISSNAAKTVTLGESATNAYTSYWYLDTYVKSEGILKEGTPYTVIYDYSVNTLTSTSAYFYSQINTARCSPSQSATGIQTANTGTVKENFVITAGQATYSSSFRFRIRFYGAAGDSVTISNLRICLGTYQECNYISDCSGYNHHSTLNKSPNIVTNTARYSCTTHFGAYQTPYSTITDTSIFPVLTNCTITWWEYCLNSGNTLLFTGHTNQYYIGAGSTTSRLYDKNVGIPIIYKDGVAETNHSSSDTTNYHTDVFHTQNSWHHYALVGANLSSWTEFKINNYNSNWPLNAYLSDVRIYCTALSAADVKQLYEMGAKIDNKQNIHTYESIESSSTIKITKQGQIKAGEFQEDTATKFYDTDKIIETNNLIEL